MTTTHHGWTQVYLGGLSQGLTPTDEELEADWEQRLQPHMDISQWAGPGSSVVKRHPNGQCRGFAFLTFYSFEGAKQAINILNSDESTPWQAELCQIKHKNKPQPTHHNDSAHHIRLRRQRKAPVAKHPVLVSSNGKKTGLGSKTR